MYIAKMKLLGSVLVILANLWVVIGQTPVPARPLGHPYLSATNPKVVVEIFYDHLCSDSKPNWPIVKEALSNVASKGVAAIIHIFPLPYHHNAYFAQQAGVTVTHESPSQFIPYLDLMFDQQEKFLGGAVNMTEPQVKEAIANLVTQHISGIDKQRILSGFDDSRVVTDSRYAWKYAASRGITGTPQFIVNGVQVPDAAEFDQKEWEDYISKLVDDQSSIRAFGKEL